MRHLAAVAHIPGKALPVAAIIERVVEKAVVGLVLGVHVQAHLVQRNDRVGIEFHDTRQGIRAIEQAGGTLEYLDRTHGIVVYLDAMLVTPLLTLLAHTVGNDHHAVVAQSSNDGLRDAAARGHL